MKDIEHSNFYINDDYTQPTIEAINKTSKELMQQIKIEDILLAQKGKKYIIKHVNKILMKDNILDENVKTLVKQHVYDKKDTQDIIYTIVCLPYRYKLNNLKKNKKNKCRLKKSLANIYDLNNESYKNYNYNLKKLKLL